MAGTGEAVTQVLAAEGRSSRQLAGAGMGAGSRAQVAMSKVAWVPTGELGQEEWICAGRKFGTVSRCAQWWIGDWLRYGSAKWGEKYVEAARITGYDIGTLRNYASVAGQFDSSLRSDKLTWSHHFLLAPCSPEERSFWIARAETERLSVADLRIELRANRRGGRPESEGALPETPTSDPGGGAAAVSCSNDDLGGRQATPTVICPHCGRTVEVGAS